MNLIRHIGFLIACLLISGTIGGQTFDTDDCPRGPVIRVPITSLTKAASADFMILTDSCGNQYYTLKDSVTTKGGVINQYFAGDTLITITQGDTFITIIYLQGDTTGTGRFRLYDNIDEVDTLFTFPAGVPTDNLNVTNGLSIDAGTPVLLKLGGRLIENTKIYGDNRLYDFELDSMDMVRTFANTIRHYITGSNGAYIIQPSNANTMYITMTSPTSFYMRADTVMQLDLYNHELSDTSHLLIRTDRARDGSWVKGGFLQLLRTSAGIHQGECDWSLYALPLAVPDSSGNYVLNFDAGDNTFDWAEESGGGGGTDSLLYWTESFISSPDSASVWSPKFGLNVDARITPKGTGGVSIGTSNTISGIYSTAFGYGNTSSGEYALAGGYSNTSSNRSFTISSSSTNAGYSGGIYGGNGNNINSGGNYSFIGGGISNIVTTNGDGGSAIGGNGNTISGNYATVIGGTSNTASGLGAVVLGGSGNIASGSPSIAGGQSCTASNGYGVALGSTATASGVVSVALGSAALSSNTYTTAIGRQVDATAVGSIVIGHELTSNKTRTIVIGLGSGASNKLTATIDSAIIFGSYSNLPTVTILKSKGVGTTGKVVVDSLLRVSGSIDTATVIHLWGSNAEGDLKKINIGSDVVIQGDSIYIVPPVAELEYWTESEQNGTQASTVWEPKNGTNVNAVIEPLGTGAFITGPAPDGTSTGGNARGANAIDIQTARTSASQVASGTRSIAIGYRATSSGTEGVAIGSVVTSSNGRNTAIGYNVAATSSAEGATAIGHSSQATGGASTAIGYLNDATAYGTLATGAYSQATLYGQRAHQAYRIGTDGDIQTSDLRMYRTITGTAATEIFLDGAAFGSQRAVLAGSNRVWNARIQVVAATRDAGNGSGTTGDAFVGNYEVGIKRIGSTTTLIGGGVITNSIAADTDMEDAVVTITADDTNEALKVTFTPPTSAGSTTQTYVNATIYLTELAF